MSKNVLVTGASRGIGKAISQKLQAQEYSGIYSKVFAPSSKELDQSSETSIKSYKKSHGLENQTLYALIINAGIHQSYQFEDYPSDEWQKLININLNSSFYLIKEFLENLKLHSEKNPQDYPRVIFTSSVSAYTGELYAPAYAASKAALIALAKSLALEFAKYQITVNCVCPGWVKTDMALTQMKNDDGIVKNNLGATLQNRWIEPEEIAGTYLYLLSDDAKAITGQQINVSAGLDL